MMNAPLRLLCPAVALVGSMLAAACAGPPEELGEPVVLAAGGASNATLAMDPSSGLVYAAWVGTTDGVSDVWLATVDADGFVSAPVRVNDVPGDAAPHFQAPPQVAVGPDGSVYVAWTNNTIIEGRRFPASNLRFARSDDGVTFEPALTVNDDAGGPPSSHTFHNLLVAPDGTIYVSWLDGRRDEAAPVEVHPAEGGPAVSPAVPGPDVRVAASTDGGRTFGPSRVVDMQTCPCCRTAMAVGPDGTLFVAWRKIYEGDVRDIVVARSHDHGATWSEPVRVAPDDWVFPGCPHAGPSLAVDGEGALHVAWYTGKPDAPGLYHASSSDGGASFGPAHALLTGEWVPPSQVALAVGRDGRLRVAWEDRLVQPAGVRFAVAGEEGLESVRSQLFQPATNPALVARGGRSVLVWLDGEVLRLAVGEGS